MPHLNVTKNNQSSHCFDVFARRRWEKKLQTIRFYYHDEARKVEAKAQIVEFIIITERHPNTITKIRFRHWYHDFFYFLNSFIRSFKDTIVQFLFCLYEAISSTKVCSELDPPLFLYLIHLSIDVWCLIDDGRRVVQRR